MIVTAVAGNVVWVKLDEVRTPRLCIFSGDKHRRRTRNAIVLALIRVDTELYQKGRHQRT